MPFIVRIFYHTQRGIEFRCFVWHFRHTWEAEYNARKFASEAYPNSTKITIEWGCGTEHKIRTLRRGVDGFFRRCRN